MAHYAKVENGIVTQVIVAEQEFINSGAVGAPEQWIQTSYNATNYAGIGYLYLQEFNKFIAPKPFSSWILDETGSNWIAPIPKPQDDKIYIWNEQSGTWVENNSVLPEKE